MSGGGGGDGGVGGGGGLPSSSGRIPRRIPLRSPQRLLRKGQPPPYVPTLHPPPSYKEAKNGNGGGGGGGTAEETRETRLTIAGGRRRCWCAFVVGALVLVVLGTGLAVGLAIGLKNTRRPAASNNDASTPNFPAGSYSFNTTLQVASTACTSNALTWPCYPGKPGESAVFTWIINQVNSSHYAISSSDNPFAPSFTNLTLSRMDMNQPSERLTFSFAMDWVILPEGSITPDDRSAKCTFKNTTFEATLWTRRDGAEVSGDAVLGDKFGPWPGDVEVKQSVDSKYGPPSCAYLEGGAIIDVRAGKGMCECRYANFEDA